MQYTSLPDGFTIQELDASHLEQFNALLRYAFQVTEEELVQVGWQEDEIKQSKFPILESAHVLGCFEGKTLAAQIAVYPMQVNVEGALLDTGFVTGVATYPEYAGIGLMSTLIRQARTEHLVPVPVLHPLLPSQGLGDRVGQNDVPHSGQSAAQAPACAGKSAAHRLGRSLPCRGA